MFSRVKPSGWTDNTDTITAAQINGIDINQSRGVDGTGGSAGVPYTPSTSIILGGSSNLEVTGTGGILLTATGPAKYIQTSTLSFTVPQPLRVANVSQQILSIGSAANGGSAAAQEASAWLVAGDSSGNPPVIRTLQSGSAGPYHWLSLDAMPDGATITSVVLGTKGLGSANNPSTKADYKLVRWSTASGVVNLSSVTADSHTYGGGGNWLTNTITTTVTPTSPIVVDKAGSQQYAVVVTNPADIGVGSAMYIYSVFIVFTTNTIRPF